MYSIQIKNKAVRLRKEGTSIYEISERLNLKPTTVSYWCKDILLTKEMRDKISRQGELKARAGMLTYTEKLRNSRMERIRKEKLEGEEIVKSLNKRDILMIGFGLYWGEGYKYLNAELGFTNSNPEIIRFYIRWLELFQIDRSDLIFKLTINDIFHSSEERIKSFWSGLLKVDKKQFTKTTFIRSPLLKADNTKLKEYYGTMRVKVRNGRSLQNRIMGALGYINSCT